MAQPAYMEKELAGFPAKARPKEFTQKVLRLQAILTVVSEWVQIPPQERSFMYGDRLTIMVRAKRVFGDIVTDLQLTQVMAERAGHLPELIPR